MTDLLTPEKIKKELAAAEGAALREADPDMQRAYLRLGRICRDYLTLWDRNKELEKERDQWKANHDCQVEMKHRLHERYDTLMKHFNGEVVL